MFPSQLRQRQRRRDSHHLNTSTNANANANLSTDKATHNTRRSDGAGGANSQGGMGSAGRSGHIHVYDYRHPPDFGRIPDPEDIFGSLEVDGSGGFVDGGGGGRGVGLIGFVRGMGCEFLLSFSGGGDGREEDEC